MTHRQRDSQTINRPTALVACIWIGIAGSSVLLILPVFVGALVDDRGFSSQAAGWIGSADLIGYALASFAAFRTVRRYAWTRIVYTGLLMMLFGNLMSTVIISFWPLFVVRVFLTGLGAGMLIAVAYTLLGDTDGPEKSTGIYWSFNVLGGAAGLVLFPRVIAAWGATGMFLFLALTSVSAVPFVYFWLPLRGRTSGTEGRASVRAEASATIPAESSSVKTPWSERTHSGPILLILGGIALFNFGLGGVWAFIERIGVETGITLLVIGTILSATYLVSMLGSAVASWQGARFGYLGPYSAGIMIMLVSLSTLLIGSGITMFILAACLMNFAWNYCLTYQFSAVFANDASGRMSVFIILVEAIGLMLGPGVAGALIERAGHSGAVWMGMTCCAFSLGLFLASNKVSARVTFA